MWRDDRRRTGVEQGLLRGIERTTGQRLESMDLPSVDDLNQRRRDAFRDRLGEALKRGDAEANRDLLARLSQELELPAEDLKAAEAVLEKARAAEKAKCEKDLRDKMKARSLTSPQSPHYSAPSPPFTLP